MNKLKDLVNVFKTPTITEPIKTKPETIQTIAVPEPAKPIQQEFVKVEPKPKNVLVILDNGHGDNTPGKRSPWSVCKVPPELPFREYKWCRDMVQLLNTQLQEDGYETLVLVPEEWDVTLAERVRRINTACKDAKARGVHPIMISVHNNAAGSGSEWKKAYGWSAWTTKGQNNSDKLATCLFNAAEAILKPLGQKTRKDMSDGDPDYEAGFYIINGAACPAVLTENMFQDCVDEVRFLISDEGMQACVDIHHQGITEFVRQMNW